MVSVYRVFTALRELANKEQKGFVTPSVFNSFAQMAQMNVYNEMFEELGLSKRARNRQEGAGRSVGSRKMTMEDLSYFVKIESLSSTDNVFDKPSNMSKLISIEAAASTAGDNDGEYAQASGGTLTRCELLYDIEKANLVLNSNLSTPTEAFPVALVHDVIEIFPTTVTNAKLVYYRVPGSYRFNGNPSNLSPLFSYSSSGVEGGYVFSPSGSLDFMLPPHMFPEIVYEIAKLIGIRLRDSDLMEYAKNEEAAR